MSSWSKCSWDWNNEKCQLGRITCACFFPNFIKYIRTYANEINLSRVDKQQVTCKSGLTIPFEQKQSYMLKKRQQQQQQQKEQQQQQKHNVQVYPV